MTSKTLAGFIAFLSMILVAHSQEDRPAIHMGIYDTEDPVRVSSETIYVVEVRNEGQGALTNCEVKCLLPDELECVAVEASVRGREDETISHEAGDGSIVFRPVVTLAPGDVVRFKLACKATAAGDAIVTATVNYTEFSKPVSSQEATVVVD